MTMMFSMLFNPSVMISQHLVRKQASKQVSPILLLDTQYALSLSTSNPVLSPSLLDVQYTFINLFDPNIYGLWLPYLPLQVSNAASLQKGVTLYNSPERDLLSNPSSALGKCYSRIGIIGNPSDGYFGNTISLTVENFFTTVSLVKSTQLSIVPHPMQAVKCGFHGRNDPLKFQNLSTLHQVIQKIGYTVGITGKHDKQGGLRLIYAALNRFYKEMLNQGIYINETPFTIRYCLME